MRNCKCGVCGEKKDTCQKMKLTKINSAERTMKYVCKNCVHNMGLTAIKVLSHICKNRESIRAMIERDLMEGEEMPGHYTEINIEHRSK